MVVFEGVLDAFASLLSITQADAGWILGLAIVLALALSFMLVLNKDEMQVGLIMAGIGVAFVVGIGWWQIWTVVFIVIILAVVLINPFGSGRG